MNKIECAWIAGILEGEGCFDYNGNKKKYPKVRLEMKDKDIVDRVQKLVGGTLRRRPAKKPQHNDTYVLQICRKENVENLLKNIRPLMGERRGHKIDSLLALFDNP